MKLSKLGYLLGILWIAGCQSGTELGFDNAFPGQTLLGNIEGSESSTPFDISGILGPNEQLVFVIDEKTRTQYQLTFSDGIYFVIGNTSCSQLEDQYVQESEKEGILLSSSDLNPFKAIFKRIYRINEITGAVIFVRVSEDNLKAVYIPIQVQELKNKKWKISLAQGKRKETRLKPSPDMKNKEWFLQKH